jgi:hypothetical protein
MDPYEREFLNRNPREMIAKATKIVAAEEKAYRQEQRRLDYERARAGAAAGETAKTVGGGGGTAAPVIPQPKFDHENDEKRAEQYRNQMKAIRGLEK